jgi:hypothetical protein
MAAAGAHLGQLVLDARRRFREVVAQEESITFQVAQSEREHPLRDAFYASFQSREVQPVTRRKGKVRHDKNGPFVAELSKDLVGRTSLEQWPLPGCLVRLPINT